MAVSTTEYPTDLPTGSTAWTQVVLPVQSRHETTHRETEPQWRDRRSAELLSRTGQSDEERARNIAYVVEINIPIADGVARRYAGRGIDAEDLIQVARLGLVQAARRFRPENGEFHSFAIPTVTGEVKRYFRDHGWSIRPPRRIQELQHEIKQAWPAVAQEQAHAPQPAEIADRLGADRAEVRRALADDTFRVSSLDAPALAADETVGRADGQFEEVDDADEQSRLLRLVHHACQHLSDDDLAILRRRYIEGYTQAAIAREFQVSQMSISRRLSRITTTLRRQLAATGADPRLERDGDRPQRAAA